MICGKCKIIPVSKILISHTRVSLFQSSEDGKQEKNFKWPNRGLFKTQIVSIIAKPKGKKVAIEFFSIKLLAS